MAADRRLVVVGGGLAGAKAVEALRAEGFGGEVHLLGAEIHAPYERPPLSKGYLAGSDDRSSVFVHDEQWYAEQDVTTRLGVSAVELDTTARRILLDDGRRMSYDGLLLATGARSRRLPWDLPGVHYLRTLDDSDALRAALHPGGRRVVVVGAGWIGLEVAAAARGSGNEVIIVEPQSVPLRSVLGERIGLVFADLHRAHGVDLRLGAGVSGLVGGDRVEGVRTDTGEVLAADVVVVGIGAVPNVELASAAGLDVGNGVMVDASMRSSDAAVWAAGDIANAFNPVLGRHLRVEHWDQAIRTGVVAARSMLGQRVQHTEPPYFFTDQYDLGMEFTGYVDPRADHRVVVHGDPDSLEFVAWWVLGGRVVAGMNVNVWDVADEIRRMVSNGVDVEDAEGLVRRTTV